MKMIGLVVAKNKILEKINMVHVFFYVIFMIYTSFFVSFVVEKILNFLKKKNKKKKR